MIENKLINDIVNKIANRFNPDKIILFGSYASGNQNEDSDVDLLVIKESTESRINRITDLKMKLLKYKFKFPIDLLVYTEKELLNENLGKYSFIYYVLNSGKLLYES